jgi:hypothetical protein
LNFLEKACLEKAWKEPDDVAELHTRENRKCSQGVLAKGLFSRRVGGGGGKMGQFRIFLQRLGTVIFHQLAGSGGEGLLAPWG